MTCSKQNQTALTRGLLVLATVLVVWLRPIDTAGQESGGGWSAPVNFSQQPSTLSDVPVMLCDPYQNVHVFWGERDSQNAAIFTRNEIGGSWSDPARVLATTGIWELAGVIALNDTAHLLWTTAVRGALTYSRAALSRTADPKGWQPPTIMARDVDSGSVTADKFGALHVIYGTSDFEGREHTLYYRRSDDGGEGWSDALTVLPPQTPVTAAFGVLRIAVDGKRRLHVTWQLRSYRYGAYSRIVYQNSTDQGHTWSAQVELGVSDVAPGVAIPAVFVFGDDEIHLTYDVPDRLHQWSSDGGLTWSKPTTILNLGAAFGGANELVKDSSGRLHAVAAVSDGVYHVIWNGDSWISAEAVDRRYIDPHHQQFAVCQGNQLHVVYDDRTGEHEIWYSTRRVSAPLIPRKPLPPYTPSATPASHSPHLHLPSLLTLVTFPILLASVVVVLKLLVRRWY
jgi:hypothetical protein